MERLVARRLEWLENFRENFEEEDVPTPWDAPANSSQESDTVAQKVVGVGKHNSDTHVPKDQNFEICTRTKITEVFARQRTGKALP